MGETNRRKSLNSENAHQSSLSQTTTVRSRDKSMSRIPNTWFLGATRSIERISYGNVAGWVAVCHSRFCIKTTKPSLKLFGPSGSPIIEAFGTPYADTKFQGEPLHRGLYIHGCRKHWRFSTEMAHISETVRDRTMVTLER